MSHGDRVPQLRKQISVSLSVADWRVLRDEAARQRLPLAELCRRWLSPDLNRLRRHPNREYAPRAAVSDSPIAGGSRRPSCVEERRRNHVWRND
ncbi:MAG: hypothetical protein M3552_02635 [Planctomycetota bacterium]|nr:hypothetical protein [Planctomycetaceae bacterium]MDQ3329544.1 hypothetical protein [Planctomycetota bacterium]